ncbi:TPA: hypothetical protein SMO12_004682 [Pseudomonas aeruginosa]|nr:hypothetical protein [Pseudomonas aeruginosa]
MLAIIIGMPIMGIIGMAAFMFIGICMAFIMAVTPVGEAGVSATGADSRQRRRTGKMPVQQPRRALHGGYRRGSEGVRRNDSGFRCITEERIVAAGISTRWIFESGLSK